jgi:trehalose 6-phosphate synthase
MNLVAKEFVAAQHPANPGVLILSRCAGAADDLPEALIVNPYIPAEVADAIATALSMPLDERIDRWRSLFTRVTSHTVHDWGRRFLDDLDRGTSRPAPASSPSRACHNAPCRGRFAEPARLSPASRRPEGP